MSESKFVLAVDLGSTGVRCGLVSHDGKIHGLVHELIHTDRPLPGRFEIDPEALFAQVCKLSSCLVALAVLTRS